MKYDRFFIAVFMISVAGCDYSETPPDQSSRTQESAALKSGTMEHDWPFDSPENLAVITLDRIMDGSKPILYVTHDEDDGGWQFLDGGDVSEENAMVVALREVADHDPTVKLLADLPLGWYAVRDAIDKPWKRTQHDH